MFSTSMTKNMTCSFIEKWEDFPNTGRNFQLLTFAQIVLFQQWKEAPDKLKLSLDQ